LLLHGLLHLLGYDHEKSVKEAKRMKREQERLLCLMREG
jgi:ssRNA-specific RNase YbeY (16S rRNA maturation enzyme)